MKAARIKSFTLIEMVLAMLFSAIVAGMAYTSITIFTRLYENYRLKRSAGADLQLMKQAISRDFSHSSLVEIDGSHFYLKDSMGAAGLYYTLNENYLVRKAPLKSDSIKFDDLAFRGFFEGLSVDKGIVDHIVLHFKSEQSPATISAWKEYSKEELFNWEDSLQNATLNAEPLWK